MSVAENMETHPKTEFGSRCSQVPPLVRLNRDQIPSEKIRAKTNKRTVSLHYRPNCAPANLATLHRHFFAISHVYVSHRFHSGHHDLPKQILRKSTTCSGIFSVGKSQYVPDNCLSEHYRRRLTRQATSHFPVLRFRFAFRPENMTDFWATSRDAI